MEKTVSFIKPDAMVKNVVGEILSRFEKGGLKLVNAKILHLSKSLAEKFYAIHRERPFFQELVDLISSGPIFVMVLEGENAVSRARTIIGATDPKKADPHTIRRDFGTNVGNNAIHGSDSVENAKNEIKFFFS